MKLVTADQMRRIDAAAIEKYGIPGVVLMENAGRHVAQVVGEMLDARPPARTLIICGKGNNGGDGLVAARHLLNAGRGVQVALLCRGEDLSGDAAINFHIARNMGVPLVEHADDEAVRAVTHRAGLIVDAVLGTGLSGEVTGVARAAIEAMNAAPAPVVAVDIPSGIHADTGAVCGVAVRADLTVTFAAAKLGLVQHPGAAHCGELRIVDISIPRSLLQSSTLQANLVTPELAAGMLPTRWASMHKGDAGKVLVVAGSVGMSGAAALAARAALRSGAGLVTIACPASLNDILEGLCMEVMTRPLPETKDRTLAADARRELLGLSAHCSAVAVGPGLSQNAETAACVRELLPAIPVPVVVDADGLNCLGQELASLARRPAPTVLTPHPGELARLLGTSAEGVQQDRVDAARRAAAESGAVVLLKGAATVVAEPGGEVWINPTGNSGMASGGMGDVLTGVVAAFLAGGAEPVAAAAAGAFYHGLAADVAAEGKGTRGLVAGDVLDALPGCLE